MPLQPFSSYQHGATSCRAGKTCQVGSPEAVQISFSTTRILQLLLQHSSCVTRLSDYGVKLKQVSGVIYWRGNLKTISACDAEFPEGTILSSAFIDMLQFWWFYLGNNWMDQRSCPWNDPGVTMYTVMSQSHWYNIFYSKISRHGPCLSDHPHVTGREAKVLN